MPIACCNRKFAKKRTKNFYTLKLRALIKEELMTDESADTKGNSLQYSRKIHTKKKQNLQTSNNGVSKTELPTNSK